MPLPTKVWADNASYSTQPPDAFLDDGLHPKKPWLTEYVNWTLNFIWGTLVGAEHDEFTGAHTDVTFDTLASNTNLGANVTLPASYTIQGVNATSVVMQPGDLYWAEADVTAGRIPYATTSQPSPLLLGGDLGLDTPASYDLSGGVPGAGFSSGITVSVVALYVWRSVGGTAGTATWSIFKTIPSTGTAVTTVATGTFDVTALPAAGTATAPTVLTLSLGGDITLESGARYTVTVSHDDGVTGELLWGGGAVAYSRTTTFGG